MADRVEREIEEILAKIDDLPASGGSPINIKDARDRLRKPKPQRAPRTNPINSTWLLLGGAGAVVGGLIASNFWEPLVWVGFAGVIVFLVGFVLAFIERPKTGSASSSSQAQGGTYWRDRYIQYDNKPSGPAGWFRRKK